MEVRTMHDLHNRLEEIKNRDRQFWDGRCRDLLLGLEAYIELYKPSASELDSFARELLSPNSYAYTLLRLRKRSEKLPDPPSLASEEIRVLSERAYGYLLFFFLSVMEPRKQHELIEWFGGRSTQPPHLDEKEAQVVGYALRCIADVLTEGERARCPKTSEEV